MDYMNWHTIDWTNPVIPIIVSLVSAILAIIVGFLTTKHYYIKASEGLTDAANRLIKLSNLIARALEEGGSAEFTRDANGEIDSVKLRGKIEIAIKTHAEASGSVIKKEET